VCRAWRAALDATVTSLAVGPRAREAPPHHWNRQQLLMQRLPGLFPCLRSLDFNQARPPCARAPPDALPAACFGCPVSFERRGSNAAQHLPAMQRAARSAGVNDASSSGGGVYKSSLLRMFLPRRRACDGRAVAAFLSPALPGSARDACGRGFGRARARALRAQGIGSHLLV